MKTKVYLDLNKTPYKILNKGLIFYFSSKFYEEKFKKELNKFVHEESLKIRNKYKVSNSFDLYLSISFYKKIEKRGFRVYDTVNKKEITDKIIFANCIVSY